ncbi:hypothetical protein SCORR_v1c07000 [Spiroplasma corruscae]|uniref:Lipoprotein n=1 Tax=Spiroplasma corruscae TaxID=216934 RepID=A0A222EPU3_9MOLU|nr:hypothetical protein [Spiroplasma corruscae]ASP28472.1 hypothetical protein SCORR_v1c07000 [Spiroplasma corruscae]
MKKLAILLTSINVFTIPPLLVTSCSSYKIKNLSEVNQKDLGDIVGTGTVPTLKELIYFINKFNTNLYLFDTDVDLINNEKESLLVTATLVAKENSRFNGTLVVNYNYKKRITNINLKIIEKIFEGVDIGKFLRPNMFNLNYLMGKNINYGNNLLDLLTFMNAVNDKLETFGIQMSPNGLASVCDIKYTIVNDQSAKLNLNVISGKENSIDGYWIEGSALINIKKQKESNKLIKKISSLSSYAGNIDKDLFLKEFVKTNKDIDINQITIKSFDNTAKTCVVNFALNADYDNDDINCTW